ncbi:MAG TPA: cytochrome c3 family protein [Bacteroidales bacterium]|nr:cytochrome c3 family protein [Bacteroidales bacterium]
MRKINASMLKALPRLLLAGMLLGLVPGMPTAFRALATATQQGHDHKHSKVKASHGYSELEVKQGERLFLGLLSFESGFTNCGSCHYSVTADTMDWNPSVFDIAKNTINSGDTNYLRKVMASPSPKMRGSHEKIELTDKEYRLVHAYMHQVYDTGLAQHKPFPARFLIFLFTGLIMLLALTDLIFTRRIPYKALTMLVLLAAAVVHVKVIAEEATRLSRTQEYAPDQPIKFSHAIHAGQNGIDCEYCHYTVRESKSAGMPPVSLCLNCHTVIRNGTNSGKFEINKIHAAVKEGKSVEWVRVHNLPDHAWFSHAQHVGAGKLECQTCHGPVETMDIVRQHSDLSMGWCINCHRDTDVDFVGNPYYATYKSLHDDLKNGRKTSIKVSDVGGLECMRCHY